MGALGAVAWTVWGIDTALAAWAVGLPLALMHTAFASAVWIRRAAIDDVRRLTHVALDYAEDVLIDWRLRVLVDGRTVCTIPLVALMRGVFVLVVRPVLGGRLQAAGRATGGLGAWGVLPLYDAAVERLVRVLYREYARHDYLHSVIVDASGAPVDSAYDLWPDPNAGPPLPVTQAVDAARSSLDRVERRCHARHVAPLVRLWSTVGLGATLVALGAFLWLT